MGHPITTTREQHEYILKERSKPVGKRPSYKAIGAKIGLPQTTVQLWADKPLSVWESKLAEELSDLPEAQLPGDIKRLLKKQPMSADELADALDVSPKRIRGAIEQMRAIGGMVSETVDHRYQITHAQAAEAGRGEVVGDSRDEWTHHFGVTTDNHLCNKHSRLDVLHEAYDYFEARGITRVFNCGNWIDGEHRFTRPECIVRPGIDAQMDYLIDNWPVKNGIHTEFIAGDDHEGWYQQRECLEIGRYLQTQAEKQGRQDLKYLGYAEADIALKCGTGEAVMRLVHPGGGSAYAISYTDQKRVESYQGGEKPQIELAGHYHKWNYGYPREVHTIQCGCTCDQTLFMRKKRLQAMVGFVEVKIKQDSSGIITDVDVSWKPRFNKGFYEKRYS